MKSAAFNRTSEGLDSHLTDVGNAERLIRLHGSDLRFCPGLGSWLVWDGRMWGRDHSGEVVRRAIETVAAIYGEAGLASAEVERKQIADHAKASESRHRLTAMIDLAQSVRGVSVQPSELDCEPYLLTCANGTLDLRTGTLRESVRGDLLTRSSTVAFDPGAECPTWLRFMGEVFAGDSDVVRFVQRLVGYTLTGETTEQVLAVLHGSGANGKSVLVETVKDLLGDLAVTAAFDTFTQTQGSRGPREDIARLRGARMVLASESGRGKRLDEATVKQLTGSDTVAARHLYREHFEFRPGFKLWLVTNHRPRVDGGDPAIWRRLRLIPFGVSFEGREDRRLREKLHGEMSGILNWAVAGCLEWQRRGLGKSSSVDLATARYRHEENAVGAFLVERCKQEGRVEVSRLREAYETFCADRGEKPLPASKLGRELARLGVTRGGSRGRYYVGLRLL